MKTFTIVAATATALTLAACTADEAAAEGLDMTVNGEVEYSIENENFAMEVGPDFAVGDFTIAPRAYASYNNDTNFDFNGVGVEAEYGLNGNVAVYGAIQTDGDFEYDDAQVGVRFKF